MKLAYSGCKTKLSSGTGLVPLEVVFAFCKDRKFGTMIVAPRE